MARRKNYVEKAARFNPLGPIEGLEFPVRSFDDENLVKAPKRVSKPVAVDSPSSPKSAITGDEKPSSSTDYFSAIPDYVRDAVSFGDDLNISPTMESIYKAAPESSPRKGLEYIDFLPDLIASAGPSVLALLGGASADVVTSQMDRGNQYAKSRADREIASSMKTGSFIGEDGRPETRPILDSLGMEPYVKPSSSLSGMGTKRLHSVRRIVDPVTNLPKEVFVYSDGSEEIKDDRLAYTGYGSFTATDPYGTKYQEIYGKWNPNATRERTGYQPGYGQMFREPIPEETIKFVQKLSESYDKSTEDIRQKAETLASIAGAIDDPNVSARELSALSEAFIRAVTVENRLSDMDIELLSGGKFKSIDELIADAASIRARGKLSEAEREGYKRLMVRLYDRYRSNEKRAFEKATKRASMYPGGASAIKDLIGIDPREFDVPVEPRTPVLGPQARQRSESGQQQSSGGETVESIIMEIEREFGVGTPDTRAILKESGIDYAK